MSTSAVPNNILISDEITPSGAPYRTITLNRTDKRNALDLQTIDALIAAIASAANRSLLINANPPAFCAGLDLKEIAETGSPETHLREFVALLVTLATHPKTTTAHIHGPARAGGVALACCTDHVVAHPNASFMIPDDPVYKPMATILPPILSDRRTLPLEKTAEMVGRILDAATAESLGFIDEVCEDRTRAIAALDHAPPTKRPINPTVLQQVNARIDRAITRDALAPLIKHLRERFSDRT